jgi:hypothetical protein
MTNTRSTNNAECLQVRPAALQQHWPHFRFSR